MAYPIYLLGCECPAVLDHDRKVVVKEHQKNCLLNKKVNADRIFQATETYEVASSSFTVSPNIT